jgi:uncharacterized repeat protein (TIGR03803 family)
MARNFSIGLAAGLTAMLSLALGVLGMATCAAAQQDKVLFSFNTSGGFPSYSGVIADASGNLYGTTVDGGAYGFYGTVFELTPSASGGWTQRVLHSFNNDGTDGYIPYGSLILDPSGNLYGTTTYGGTYGFGTVFKVTPIGGDWTETILHNFNHNGVDGAVPYSGLIFDAPGNLYGTTGEGGAYDSGTAFELIPSAGGQWTETILHSFIRNGSDGLYPTEGLIFDTSGNLYGTTTAGGAFNWGVLYRLTTTPTGKWTEKLVHNFGPADGIPNPGLVFDASGNLFGTGTIGSYGFGTVFELTPKAGGGFSEKIVHAFRNFGHDGIDPSAGPIMDASGNLYGTTQGGGAYGYGTVFELMPKADGGWSEKILHSLRKGQDGYLPYGVLAVDASGNLYGTTTAGGTYNDGIIFEVSP